MDAEPSLVAGPPEGVSHSRSYHSDPARRPAPAAGSISDWLLGEGRHIATLPELFDALCWLLVARGVPLARTTLHVGTLHPLYLGTGCRWRRDDETTVEFQVVHGIRERRAFLDSPLRPVLEGGVTIRRRLESDATFEFPILAELKQEGMTEYLAMPLVFSGRRRHTSTWATDRPGGFADSDVATLKALHDALAVVAENLVTRRVASTLLDTYLGRQAGARVLAGSIQRGDGETIRAVIFRADLRGYTRMSDSLPGERVIATLNDYFERVVEAVHAQGGDVLKFIGDGVLAIFAIADPADAARICGHALAATRTALAGIAALNQGRRDNGEGPLEVALALHLGDVMFGNVGAADRLDFTVIGPAVNLVSRMEQLARPLGRHVLISDDFAAAARSSFVSLGFHSLRGLREPHELFTLVENSAR